MCNIATLQFIPQKFYSTIEHIKQFFQTKETPVTQQMLQKAIQDLQDSLNPTPEQLDNAQVLLNRAIRLNPSVNEGFSHAKANPYLLTIAQLDRHLMSKDPNKPKEYVWEEVKSHYQTQIAKDQLDKFCEKTQRGRKHESEDYIITPECALKTFLDHPEVYDCMVKAHILRSASAFNFVFPQDAQGNMLVPYNGSCIPFLQVARDFEIKEKRLWNSREEHYYVFTQNGLERSTPLNDRIDWSELAPYKIKQRKHTDFRFSIVTSLGKEVHSWIRLKTPEGYIYSVGAFWKEFPGYSNLCATVDALIESGDRHEFLGKEKEWHVTKFIINAEQFKTVKTYIEKLKKEGLPYHLLENNCTSFVKKIAHQIGISPSAESNDLHSYLVSQTNIENPFLATIVKTLLVGVAMLSNLFMYFMGGTANLCQHVTGEPKRMFKNVWEILDPSKHRYSHPKILREWQKSFPKGAVIDIRT